MGNKRARSAAGPGQRTRQASTKGEVTENAKMIGHEIEPTAAVENN